MGDINSDESQFGINRIAKKMVKARVVIKKELMRL
jgi:hypothetical protein